MSDRRAEQCCTFTSQFEDPSISEEVKRLLVRLCEDQPELLADLRYGAELYEEQEEESGYMVCEGSGVDQEHANVKIMKFPHDYKVWADMVKAGAEFVHSDEFKVYQDEYSMDFLCEAAGSISIGTRSMAASDDADVSMESTYDGEAISIEITKQSNTDTAMSGSSVSPFSSESFQASESDDSAMDLEDMQYQSMIKERLERLSGLYSILFPSL